MAVSSLATKYKFENFGAVRWGSRGNTRVDTIVIHHAATTNFDAMPGVWKSREASAHYGIGQKGEIRAYIDETKRAWHAGNENSRSIGIECTNTTGAPNWIVSDATVTALVALIQDIKKRYNITRIIGHRDGVGAATACPGPSLYPRMQEIRNRVNGQAVTPPSNAGSSSSSKTITVKMGATHWSPSSDGKPIGSWVKGQTFVYDKVREISYSNSKKEYRLLNEGKAIGWLLEQDIEGKSASSPGTSIPQIAVDGYWGVNTTKRIQQILGLVADGILGKKTISAIQRIVGVTVDGIMGPQTIRGMQRYFGTVIDGIISKPSTMVKAMQTRLNQNRF